MPTEGRRSPKTTRPKGGRRPKLNALQRHQRGRVIASLRARPRPIAWATIAKQVGMSVSGAKDAHDQFIAAESSMIGENSVAVIDETIDALTIVLHDEIANMEAAPLGSSARTGAGRAAIEAAIQRLHVMRAAGRVPRSLDASSVAAEMQVVFRELAAIFERHAVPDEAIRDLAVLAESRMGRLTAIDGRALPSAA